MKEKLLVLGTMVALCCSCAGSSVLLDTESELNGLNNEYELGTLEAGDNGLKCETSGDEDSIQVLKDNYIAEIMGRMEVAKEKVMRTAYGATSPRVGVFRVGSCGNYKYLSIKIDCENGNSKTSVSGNVGDTYVDGGDNMRLEFCMVDAGFRYPGGVFLFEDVPLETMTLVRYHDTEDGGHNGVWSDDPNYYDVMHISGMSKLDSNAIYSDNRAEFVTFKYYYRIIYIADLSGALSHIYFTVGRNSKSCSLFPHITARSLYLNVTGN